MGLKNSRDSPLPNLWRFSHSDPISLPLESPVKLQDIITILQPIEHKIKRVSHGSEVFDYKIK